LKWQAVVECPVNGDHFRTFNCLIHFSACWMQFL
jgi:hypothetical protein